MSGSKSSRCNMLGLSKVCQLFCVRSVRGSGSSWNVGTVSICHSPHDVRELSGLLLSEHISFLEKWGSTGTTKGDGSVHTAG